MVSHPWCSVSALLIPIAFDDPHQLHSYPRLHVHLPSSRRVVARSGRLASALVGAPGRAVCVCLSRALRSIANPFTPEVPRVIREVLASPSPRGVPDDCVFFPNLHHIILCRVSGICALRRVCILIASCTCASRPIMPTRRGMLSGFLWAELGFPKDGFGGDL